MTDNPTTKNYEPVLRCDDAASDFAKAAADKSQGRPSAKNSSLPLVSICIGTYNREKLIRECLDSVFAQTYRPIEVIVADNASTDRTLDIVRAYPEIKIARRHANSGMCSTTRNMACREATGEFIALLDSDDAWKPEKLERQVAFLQAHPEIPLCHTYCHLMDEASCVYGIRHDGQLPATGDCFDALLNHCWITISSVMIRRSLYQEFGPFKEELPYGKSGEDYEFFLRVARMYPAGMLPEPLTLYRKSIHSMTATDWRATPHALSFYRALIGREDIWGGRITKSALRRKVMSFCFENSAHWRDQGYPSRALWAARQALAVDPVAPETWEAIFRSIGRLVWRRGT